MAPVSVFRISRRTLLTTVGGGVVVAGGAGLWLGVDRIRNERFRKPVHRAGFTPNVFLSVQPSGAVEIWLTRSEMGQGVSTALPVLVAEELDADWDSVVVHQARAESAFDYGRLFTAASSSIPSLWVELRRAGAVAREMLVAAAAEIWEVGADQCRTRSGRVLCGELSMGYGELADLAAKQWVPIRPELKAPGRFRLIGRPVPRLDIPDKVAGGSGYGADVDLPGLLRAVVLRPPRRGATLASFDDSASRAVPGVVDIFPIERGIAVVARGLPAAMRARSLLRPEWSGGAAELSDREIRQRLKEGLSEPGVVAYARGETGRTDAGTEPYHSAEYEVPYLAHACMEPMNCTARVGRDRAELWVGTQAPQQTRETAAAVAGLPVERVVVNVLQLGGGFGRRTGQDFVSEAVAIAGRFDVPVQLFWTREDDIGDAPYRDAARIAVRGYLDQGGRLSRLVQHSATAVPGPAPADPGIGPVMGADTLPYRVKGFELRWSGVTLPLPVTIWRSVGYSYNTFAMESFIDELAHELGQDSLEFRLELLPGDGRLARCLETVGTMCGWAGSTDRHLGIAAYDFSGTAVAMVAEVVGDAQGWRVGNVWCAVDCGIVVQPDAASAQIEGGILQGLSAALYERIGVGDGKVVSRNFDRYHLARMSDTPEMEIRFLAGAGYPGGLGEASTPGIAPAIANALYRATGRRYRRLPLKG